MTYPPSNPGYPPPNPQSGSQFDATQQFAKAVPTPAPAAPAAAPAAAQPGENKLPEILLAVVAIAGLLIYFVSFALDASTSQGMVVLVALPLLAGLLAGVSLLPKQNKYTGVVAAIATIPFLFVIGAVVSSGGSADWTIWVLLVLTLVQAAPPSPRSCSKRASSRPRRPSRSSTSSRSTASTVARRSTTVSSTSRSTVASNTSRLSRSSPDTPRSTAATPAARTPVATPCSPRRASRVSSRAARRRLRPATPPTASRSSRRPPALRHSSRLHSNLALRRRKLIGACASRARADHCEEQPTK